MLALVSEGISRVTPLFHVHTSNVNLALYFNAASYFVSALTVYFIREIPKRSASGKISVPSTLKAIWEGWRFIGQTPVVRGLVLGMVGAFAAAGAGGGDVPTSAEHAVTTMRLIDDAYRAAGLLLRGE